MEIYWRRSNLAVEGGHNRNSDNGELPSLFVGGWVGGQWAGIAGANSINSIIATQA